MQWVTLIQEEGDYEFIKNKTQNVFYSPEIATKEVVDEVFEAVNDRRKVLKILAVAKKCNKTQYG